MQAMAQMGYQEQVPIAALFPVQNEKKSNCTPHRPKARFHVRFYDFVEICQGDGACADVLRYFEMQTDWLIDQLSKAHRMAEGYIPDPDDLWISASYRDVSEGICHSQSHTTCGDRIGDLIGLGFLERRFIARAEDVEERPTVPFYEDRNGVFLVVDDQWGDYIDGNGTPRNAVDEGYTIIEWQYRYCIDKVNIALAGAFLDPPEPAKRWPPVVKRRDPMKKSGAPAPTNCDLDSADNALDNNQLSSQPSAQGGTLNADVCKGSGYSHDTVDTKDLSTVRQDILTNVPIVSVPSQEISGISKSAEDFCEAPWSLETLIGLARSRHTPGLFEIRDDDADYEGAEKLDGLMRMLGLSPTQFWPLVDQHIMAMMYAETWWATKRKGKNKRFTLIHVANQWDTVEDELKAHPYSPLDPVHYFGPAEDEGKPRDHSWIFGNVSPPEDEEQPEIVGGSLESPEPFEMYDVQGNGDLPGETEEEMHQLPPPVGQWPQSKRGMTQPEFDELCLEIWQDYPRLALDQRVLTDGSLAINIECRPGQWMPVRNATDWRQRHMTNLSRAVEDAVKYAESRSQGGA